jgi:DNA polymerase III subunit epsilon
MNFVAIDFETANRHPNSACAIGLVRVDNGIIVRQEYYQIRPPTAVFEFTHIHHLTWEMVKNEPSFGQLWPQIAPLLIDIDFLAAHHALFDREVLQSCCDFYQIDRLTIPMLCTVKLARQHWRIYPTKLPNVCQRLGIPLNHHQALSDAHACTEIILLAQGARLTNAYIDA